MEMTTPTATQITTVTYSEELLVIEWANGTYKAPIRTLMACTAPLMC